MPRLDSTLHGLRLFVRESFGVHSSEAPQDLGRSWAKLLGEPGFYFGLVTSGHGGDSSV
jgi:hypothetical protein